MLDLSQKATTADLKGDQDGEKENFESYRAGLIYPGANLFFPLGVFGADL
jgi:hypothetical protein